MFADAARRAVGWCLVAYGIPRLAARRGASFTGRAVALAVASGTCGLALAPSAMAGTYEVNACSMASNWVSRSWAAQVNNTAPGYDVTGTFQACSATDPEPFMRAELRSVTSTSSGSAPGAWDAASADWALVPLPAGTRLQRLTASVRCDDSGSTESWVIAGDTRERCQSATFTTVDLTATGDVSTARAVVRCAALTSCAAASSLGSIDIRDLTAWIDDPVAPTVTAAGGTLPSGFAEDQATVTFAAADNAGVRESRLIIDGATLATVTYACDFTRVRPCEDQPAASLTADTSNLSSGDHTWQVEVVDAAGNVTSSPAAGFYVDRVREEIVAQMMSPGSQIVSVGDDDIDDVLDVGMTDAAGAEATALKARYGDAIRIEQEDEIESLAGEEDPDAVEGADKHRDPMLAGVRIYPPNREGGKGSCTAGFMFKGRRSDDDDENSLFEGVISAGHCFVDAGDPPLPEW